MLTAVTSICARLKISIEYFKYINVQGDFQVCLDGVQDIWMGTSTVKIYLH